MVRSTRPRALRLAGLLAAFLLVPSVAQAGTASDYEFASPLFGLARAPGGSLLVADTGAGVVELIDGSGSLIVELPGVVDIAPIRRGTMHAVSGGEHGMLYRIVDGQVHPMADIAAFEAAVNPDGGIIETNAFDVAALNRRALIADAAGNSLLFAGPRGRLDWVANFPHELVPTKNAKQIAGCPDAPEDLAFVCELPYAIPAEPVATSVAVGPDGAYYVGELKGFPAPVGMSRIWRIEPGTRHAECGSSPACSVVADGFTSIIDLNFRRNGSLLVTELDESSWLAAEFGAGTGGTVSACDVTTGTCEELATGLPLPTAAAATRGHVYATIWSLVPGDATVSQIA